MLISVAYKSKRIIANDHIILYSCFMQCPNAFGVRVVHVLCTSWPSTLVWNCKGSADYFLLILLIQHVTTLKELVNTVAAFSVLLISPLCCLHHIVSFWSLAFVFSVTECCTCVAAASKLVYDQSVVFGTVSMPIVPAPSEGHTSGAGTETLALEQNWNQDRAVKKVFVRSFQMLSLILRPLLLWCDTFLAH